MSGAPGARYFDVQHVNGDGATTSRYTLEPKILTDTAMKRLRAVLVRRRREQRQQMIKDFADFGKDLPPETKAAFAKEVLADAKADVSVSMEDVAKLMETIDEEAIATLLWTCSPEIGSYDEAAKVLREHGNPMEVYGLLAELMTEEFDAAGNLPRHPVTE